MKRKLEQKKPLHRFMCCGKQVRVVEKPRRKIVANRCSSVKFIEANTIEEARSKLLDEGWTVEVNQGLHFWCCPSCSKKEK